MKILIVSHVPRDPTGGAAGCSLELASHWRRAGIEVEDYYADELPRIHAGRLTPDLSTLRIAGCVASLAQDVDVVIATGPIGWASFRRLRRRDPRPFLVCLSYGLEHQDYEVQMDEAARGAARLSRLARLRWKALLRPAVESSVSQADLFIAPRRRDTDRAVASGWKNSDQVLAVGWGVDDEAFQVAVERSVVWKAKVAWCGTTVDRKGWVYFRDGFVAAARAMPGLTLDVFGTRLEPQAVLRQFPMDVVRRITVLPVLGRSMQFRRLATADVFVSTSLSEGYHLALQEAMALGIPVIATAEGFIADLPPSERPVLEIPKRDSGSVHAGIDRLAQSAELREQLSSRGRTWAARRTWGAVARHILFALDHRINE